MCIRDRIGPLSDNVSGISMALDTIVGYDETECTSLNQKFSSFTDIATQDREKLQEDVKDMKVLCINQFKDVTDEHINKIIDESVDKIGDMGAEVVESSFDYIDLRCV